MLKTKSVYSPGSEDDGLRVLVTRYWPRGVKKEKAAIWLKDLGPSPGLIKKWKAGAIPWGEFRKEYLKEDSMPERLGAFDELRSIIKKAGKGNVTLLCTCKEGEDHCHREILREKMGGRT